MALRITPKFAYDVSVHDKLEFYRFVVTRNNSYSETKIRNRVKKEFPHVLDDNIKIRLIGKVVRLY